MLGDHSRAKMRLSGEQQKGLGRADGVGCAAPKMPAAIGRLHTPAWER